MDLNQIQSLIEQYACKISASEVHFPTFGDSEHTGRPNIEIDNMNNLFYVVCERGVEYERKTTTSVNELLFWVFEDITHTIAFDFEFNNRIENQDCRVIAFKKQEELLGIINNEWGEKIKSKHKKLLSPSDEIKRLRKDYSNELELQGVDSWEAWKKACQKYPTE